MNERPDSCEMCLTALTPRDGCEVCLTALIPRESEAVGLKVQI